MFEGRCCALRWRGWLGPWRWRFFELRVNRLFRLIDGLSSAPGKAVTATIHLAQDAIAGGICVVDDLLQTFNIVQHRVVGDVGDGLLREAKPRQDLGELFHLRFVALADLVGYFRNLGVVRKVT